MWPDVHVVRELAVVPSSERIIFSVKPKLKFKYPGVAARSRDLKTHFHSLKLLQTVSSPTAVTSQAISCILPSVGFSVVTLVIDTLPHDLGTGNRKSNTN